MESSAGKPVGGRPTVVQEVPRFVPIIEVQEIVKEVPQVEIEYIEKYVDVPHVEYLDKYVEREEIREVEKRVPFTKYVDVPVEKTVYKPVKTERIVEKIVRTPSKTEKIFHTAGIVKDVPFVVPQFKDTEVPLIISQTIVPEIEETMEEIEVQVCKYIPELVPVDIYVPRPISIPVHKTSTMNQERKASVGLPAEVMQKLMIEMNPHLQELEKFNTHQNKVFQETISQSNMRAQEIGVEPVPPLSAPLFTVDQQKSFWETYGDPNEILKRDQAAFRQADQKDFDNLQAAMASSNMQNLKQEILISANTGQNNIPVDGDILAASTTTQAYTEIKG